MCLNLFCLCVRVSIPKQMFNATKKRESNHELTVVLKLCCFYFHARKGMVKKDVILMVVNFLLSAYQVNHSDIVTTEDHAHEVKGPAGLFSWDYLFSLRSPLNLKAGEQVRLSS